MWISKAKFEALEQRIEYLERQLSPVGYRSYNSAVKFRDLVKWFVANHTYQPRTEYPSQWVPKDKAQ